MIKLLEKKLSFKYDLLLTILNGFIVLFGIFLLNGYIARIYGVDFLGEYLLVRRFVFSLVSIMLIGINIGLPVLIARKLDNVGDLGILIFISFTIPLSISATLIMKFDLIGQFPDMNIWSYFLFILGVSLQFLTYGLFRGHLNMIGANVIQLVSTALIPIFIFILKFNLEISLRYIGIFLIVFNILNYLKRNDGFSISKCTIKNFKIVTKFGFIRFPSFFSQFILLAFVPILISRTENYSDVAYFSSGLAILRALLIVVGPIGIIILPRISSAISDGRIQKVKNGLEVLIEVIIIFSIIIAISLSMFGSEIIYLWLGSTSVSGVWIVKTILLFLPFYIFVDILRSPIDGMSMKGYNSIIYSISAFTLVVTYFALRYVGFNEIVSGVYSFGIGFIIASIASFLFVKQKLGVLLPNIKYFALCLISIIVLVSLRFLMQFYIKSNLVIIGLYFLIVVMLSLIILKYYLKDWRARISLT